MNKISVAVLLLLFGALLSGRAAAQEVLNYMTWQELEIGGMPDLEKAKAAQGILDYQDSEKLSARCAPMSLRVYAGELPRSLTDYRRGWIDAGLDPPYLDLNLDTYTIENEAESHLRAAGLFRPEETTEQMVERALAEQRRDEIIPRLTLSIEVRVFGPAFSLNTDLERFALTQSARDAEVEALGTVTVWSTRTLGTHGDNAQFVLGVITSHIDKLIIAYLRANAGECAA